MFRILKRIYTAVILIGIVFLGAIVLGFAFYILPAVLILVGIRYLYNKHSRNSMTRHIESGEYMSTPPDNLRPIELGILLDYTMSRTEIISILMYLVHIRVIALEINEPKRGLNKGSYTLTLLEPNCQTLRKYEQSFIMHLFGTHTSVSWNSFDDNVQLANMLGDITFQAMQELQMRGYLFFSKDYTDLDYQKAKRATLTSPRTIFLSIWNIGLGLSAYRTQKAISILPRIYAFSNYLKTAEKERATFHTDPKRYSIYVEEYFPYMLALDIIPLWGDEMLGMNWESANNSRDFNTLTRNGFK